uniref:Dynein, light chain, roadblock-type 1 n=1 Tax=Fundulus heteroclitus TaxID=8078 RepID=A0A3Q2PT38_FUNHE
MFISLLEETLKRIQSQKGVQGIIIVNAEGIPVKSTLDNQSTVQYSALIHQLVMKARSTLRDIDPQNDLTFLRVHFYLLTICNFILKVLANWTLPV